MAARCATLPRTRPRRERAPESAPSPPRRCASELARGRREREDWQSVVQRGDDEVGRLERGRRGDGGGGARERGAPLHVWRRRREQAERADDSGEEEGAEEERREGVEERLRGGGGARRVRKQAAQRGGRR